MKFGFDKSTIMYYSHWFRLLIVCTTLALGESTRTTSESGSVTSSPNSMLAVTVCRKQFYCREASRGPCGPNEVLVAGDSGRNVSTNLSCSHLSSYPWKECDLSKNLPSIDGSSIKVGKCVVRFEHRPCFGYPKTYRFHSESKKCFPDALLDWNVRPGHRKNPRSPCSVIGQIFTSVNSTHGRCQCREDNHVMWQKNGTCYHAFTQGPCRKGQWVEPKDTVSGACAPSPCRNSDGFHIHWDFPELGPAGCYESFSRGPCKKGSIFIIDNLIERITRCVKTSTSTSFIPYSSEYFSILDHPSYSNHIFDEDPLMESPYFPADMQEHFYF